MTLLLANAESDSWAGFLRSSTSCDTFQRSSRDEAHESARRYADQKREEALWRSAEHLRVQVSQRVQRSQQRIGMQRANLQQVLESQAKRAHDLRQRIRDLNERDAERAAKLEMLHHSWRHAARVESLKRQQLVVSSRIQWADQLRGNLYNVSKEQAGL